MAIVEAVGMFGDGRTDGSSGISAGGAGLWIVLALLVALFFLYRSMRKQIRRISFDESGTTDEERMRGRRNAD